MPGTVLTGWFPFQCFSSTSAPLCMTLGDARVGTQLSLTYFEKRSSICAHNLSYSSLLYPIVLCVPSLPRTPCWEVRDWQASGARCPSAAPQSPCTDSNNQTFLDTLNSGQLPAITKQNTWWRTRWRHACPSHRQGSKRHVKPCDAQLFI